MIKKMDKKLLALVTIFLIVFSLFTSLMIFNKKLSTLTRAKEDFSPSSSKTLLFAWPLLLPADGRSESTITIFVRNEKLFPLNNKKVILTSDLGTIKEIQSISQKDGKAEFKISSSIEGVAKIKATVDNIPIAQTISIKFYKQ